MNIVIITQDDPFYLGENIDFLLSNLPVDCTVKAAVVFDVSPFGKKETFSQKARKTITIFGWEFFLRYSFKFLVRKLSLKTQVKTVLKRHKVKQIRLPSSINSKSSLQIIKDLKPDLLISIAGNQIFKKPLLEIAPLGCINLHTALLPKYRGLMPTFWVLKNDDPFTGVSVFFVDEGIDSGPIIVQRKVAIMPGESQSSLIKRTKMIGMQSIIEAVERINQQNFTLIENDSRQMSYYSFPTKEDVREFRKQGKRFF
jgi:methionyl-tRNA formyltransferase